MTNKINDLVDVVVMDINPGGIVIDVRTRDWCKLPYSNHPKGCPNYGKRKECPPQAHLFEDVVEPPFTLVGAKFNIEKWVRHMKTLYPNWSDRQARCCLYWQGKVRKKLREKCEQLVSNGCKILYVPEAMGVNMFKTCENVGIKLERNPQNIVWKIAIIGKEKFEMSIKTRRRNFC